MKIAGINPKHMGLLHTLEYRVETPYKNGPLDQLFQTAEEAIAEADERAQQYGSSYVIDLETVDANNNDILDGATTDFITGRHGGTGVSASRQLTADALYVKTEDLDFDDTSLAYTVNATNSAGTASGNKPIVTNATYNFEDRKVIKSFENQTTVSTTPLIKTPTLTLDATMSTTNKNIEK